MTRVASVTTIGKTIDGICNAREGEGPRSSYYTDEKTDPADSSVQRAAFAGGLIPRNGVVERPLPTIVIIGGRRGQPNTESSPQPCPSCCGVSQAKADKNGRARLDCGGR